MKFSKFFLLLALSLVLSSFLHAEDEQREIRIKVVVLDSLRSTPVEFATASVTKVGEETPFKYALSDARGLAEIRGIIPGSYSLRIEYLGYETYIKSIVLDEHRVIDLGEVKLKEQLNTLNSVVVSAVGNPIIVKKDTVEYNASSFKTTDSDMLEELLKKLPGIEVDSDGKITANGKEITKIMIDGKAFFLNDPQLATKNLPAKIIEKVKVVEKKSEQAQFTGIDDGEEETVIDLSIRPGMMNGWFGNVSAGYGTEERYQAAGMVGNFTKTSQLTAVANINNTNNRGFSDIAGGMMAAMRNSSGMGGSMIRMGGATMRFGGSGLTTSWMGGVNANKDFNDGKLKIGGNYLYSGSDRLQENKTFRQNFLKDSTFDYSEETISNSFSDGHRAALNIEYKFNDRTSILFRPNVSITKGSFEDSRDFWTKGGSGVRINEGSSISRGENSAQSFEGDLLLRHRFSKPGRTFSLNMDMEFSNNELFNGVNTSRTIIGNDTDSSIVDQRFTTDSKSYDISARASYTEPLGKNYYMELAYRFGYRYSDSDKKVYNKGIDDDYDVIDPLYTNYFENIFVNHRAEVNLRKNEEKYSYVLGVNAQPSLMKSVRSDGTIINRSVVNFAPSAQLDLKFTDTRNLRLRYTGRTRQPSINQLQPVIDNSNPLLIPTGNPDLLPEFEHSLNANYRDTKRETFRTIDAGLRANYTQDRIVTQRWYDESGVQYTMPVNASGSFNINANLMYNTPIKKSKFSVMNFTNAGVNKGVSFSGRTLETLQKGYTTTLSISEMLRFMYRGEKLEVSVGGRVRYNYAWYTIQQTEKPATWNNAINGSVNWTLPAGFNLATDMDYNFYIGYGEGYNDPAMVWNAEISKLLFKNSATLRLKVFDILNESKSVWRTTTDNYIEDVQNNTLQQYFMLSFTWRFGNFGGQKGGSQPMRGPGMGGGRFHR
ncbi:MAG: outer membrane beta-barrel family protein [Bacteroidales bacterium]|jgi:hypothetical protein|nr:outer membrane beta-barrel family protein [Bacteroidales bacterium]